MLLHIRHETVYEYGETARHSVQSLRLTPRRERGQRTLSWRMTAPGRRTEQIDAHGNVSHLLTLDEPHREIRLIVQGTVDVLNSGPITFERGTIAPLVYVAATPLTAADASIVSLAGGHLSGPEPRREQLEQLAAAVQKAVRYQPGATSVTDSAISALQRGEGVCQDQAHVFLACCRALRVPARYVSGYLLAGSGPEEASHAWVDVWHVNRAGSESMSRMPASRARIIAGSRSVAIIWTLRRSAACAAAAEMRHYRSMYWWRKRPLNKVL
jgi:transglutaminase-like putative cysteine protease